MSSEDRTQGVSMLAAFKRNPAVSGSGKLDYPNLESVAQEAHQKEYPILNEFFEAESGSVLEEDRARDAALGYLVLTGLQLQKANPENQQLISDRYTRASIELYGEPELGEYQQVIQSKITEFRMHQINPEVDQSRNKQILKVLAGHQVSGLREILIGTNESDKAREAAAKRLVKEVQIQFADVLTVFDDLNPSEPITTVQVVALYGQALDQLKKQDPAWEGWVIKPVPNQKSFACEPKEKAIIIGMEHEPLTPLKTQQLFYHEVLVHALRSVNGGKTNEPMMQFGLPDSLDAEEGLGVFLEYGLSGEIDSMRTDRYLDFGLALGTSGTPPITRSQLQQLDVNRKIVRAQARREAVNEATIVQSSWSHVNRIFRGALDNDVIAVNTKDLAYNRGFLKIGDYVAKALHDGLSEKAILDYLLCGKFDPTNKRHAALVATLI